MIIEKWYCTTTCLTQGESDKEEWRGLGYVQGLCFNHSWCLGPKESSRSLRLVRPEWVHALLGKYMISTILAIKILLASVFTNARK